MSKIIVQSVIVLICCFSYSFSSDNFSSENILIPKLGICNSLECNAFNYLVGPSIGFEYMRTLNIPLALSAELQYDSWFPANNQEITTQNYYTVNGMANSFSSDIDLYLIRLNFNNLPFLKVGFGYQYLNVDMNEYVRMKNDNITIEHVHQTYIDNICYLNTGLCVNYLHYLIDAGLDCFI